MMTALLFLAAAVWVSGAILTAVHLRRAPVAVEDANGFQILRSEDAMEVNTATLREAGATSFFGRR